MSDANTTIEDARESVTKLEAALKAERAEHNTSKAKLREFRGSIAKPLGLAADAPDDAITARLIDTEKAIADRTASLTKERDDATARAADVESRWARERIEASLRVAFEKSGAKPEHTEDFLLLSRGLFDVDANGRVATRQDASDTIPGIDPAAWIHGELRAKRAHYWPSNVSGGASGKSGIGTAELGDTSCFKRGSSWNVTAQFAYEVRYGTVATDAARRRHGGGR